MSSFNLDPFSTRGAVRQAPHHSPYKLVEMRRVPCVSPYQIGYTDVKSPTS